MGRLLGLARSIDRVNVWLGRGVGWLILAAIFISAANAATRKTLAISSNAWLELQWYLFGCAYLVAAAYTLKRNEHIRIDIISSLLPSRVRDWIDIAGHLAFLLPFTGVMIWETAPFVLRSFELGEVSPNAGGLILWPAKAFILVGFVLLFFQGISELIKRIAIMRGLMPEEPGRGLHQMPVE